MRATQGHAHRVPRNNGLALLLLTVIVALVVLSLIVITTGN